MIYIALLVLSSCFGIVCFVGIEKNTGSCFLKQAHVHRLGV